MNEVAAKLESRVVRFVVVFSLANGLLLSSLVPELLLLDEDVAQAVAERETGMLVVSGLLALSIVFVRVRRHRFLLRSLALGSRSIEPTELAALGAEPGRITRRWLLPHVLAEILLGTLARPAVVDVATGTSLSLLGGILVGATSLLLYAMIRSLFLRAMELAPPEAMREIIEAAERQGGARWRIQRRLRTAIATPVALVSVGAALIAGAHVRRADEYAREGTARAIARSALELGPGVVETAGLDDVMARARDLGFTSTLHDAFRPYALARSEDGLSVLSIPLDRGSAVVAFHGSTVPIVSLGALLVALVTVASAAALGSALGRSHTLDLQRATEGIRNLGTEAVIRGSQRPTRPPRFRIVADLESAIERLAERFRVFARAQERAILAREAAARTRGLFFASVSHDLKSPLNAILGFAELVRAEPLTGGQSESLDVIQRRGRELLALIETILDAARVEAGQLSLVIEPTKTSDLFGDAFAKARDLGGESTIEIVGEIGEGATEFTLDRVRMARALSTLVAFAARRARVATVHVRATRDGASHAVIEVEMPGRRGHAPLARLLRDAGKPGGGEHRGLALAVSLARSIIELHGGHLEAVEGRTGSAAFSVRLPLRVV